MSSMLIVNAVMAGLNGMSSGQAVLCRDGKIAEVGPVSAVGRLPADSTVDAGGGLLAPGFIDLHLHGLHEHLIDNGPGALRAVCETLPRYGVTSFLPCVCPRPKGEDAEFLAGLSRARCGGAQILGFHLEGPFLSLTGALPPEAIGKADPERVEALMAAASPCPAVFSIAPDFEGIAALIPLMRRGGGPVFMTHTGADVEQTQTAIEAGARHATHFYDVFPYPGVRDPGVRRCGAVEAVLADPRVSVDFILDGEHVDPVAVQMALACKGPDRVCLITDAMVGAGLPPARHTFVSGMVVEYRYEGGPARDIGNGGLAGSGLTMDRAVRNAVRMLGVEIPLALRMASSNPARVLGVEQVKGEIRAGFDADMVLLDDGLNVRRTWIRGNGVFGMET